MDDAESTSHVDPDEERLIADLKSSLSAGAHDGAPRGWGSTVPMRGRSTLSYDENRNTKRVPDISFTTDDWPIADYEPLRTCGRGAFGEVWIVRDRAGVLRALKILDLRSVRRHHAALRELEALRRYCALPVHIHRISVSHIGQTTDCLYYTMELADDANTGGPIVEDDLVRYVPSTLKELFRREPPNRDQSLLIVRDLLSGLAELHDTELAHRDVKPENVVFVGGQAKLADIGMTTGIAPQERGGGTPGYMPPDMRTDATADTYAMSKVLFEMLAWPEPVRVPWVPASLRKPGDKQAQLLNDALVKGCAPQGDDRYANATEMAAALESCTAPPADSPDGRSGRPKTLKPIDRRLVRRLVGLWFVLAGVVVAINVWPEPRTLSYVDFMATAITLDDQQQMSQHELSNAPTLHPGDMLNVVFRTDEPAYVYVFLKSESGVNVVLYPLTPSIEDRITEAGVWQGISPPGQGFILDEELPLEGKVRLYLVVSSEPLSLLTRTMRRQNQSRATTQPITPPSPHHLADDLIKELKEAYKQGGRYGLVNETLPEEYRLRIPGAKGAQPDRNMGLIHNGRVVIVPFIDFDFAHDRHAENQPTHVEPPPTPVPDADVPASLPDA
jgi:serine/threonine protein kinase